MIGGPIGNQVGPKGEPGLPGTPGLKGDRGVQGELKTHRHITSILIVCISFKASLYRVPNLSSKTDMIDEMVQPKCTGVGLE